MSIFKKILKDMSGKETNYKAEESYVSKVLFKGFYGHKLEKIIKEKHKIHMSERVRFEELEYRS
ncbi:hypothetical protein HI914_04183 [Erysiphe necator]|nr:hypothetical protein HI914_04183 [Erysiphe necator]